MLNDQIWNNVASHCGGRNVQLDQLNPVGGVGMRNKVTLPYELGRYFAATSALLTEPSLWAACGVRALATL